MSYIISVNKLREMEPFNQDYASNATPEEKALLTKDLRDNGIIHPLIITKVNGEYKIVKGNTRAEIIKGLDDNGEWKYDDIPVTEISFEEALTRFISESLARKDYSKMQRAMFGHWFFRVANRYQGINDHQNGDIKINEKVNSNREYIRSIRKLCDETRNNPKVYKLIFTLGADINNKQIEKLTNYLHGAEEDEQNKTLDNLIAAYEADRKSDFNSIINPVDHKEDSDGEADEVTAPFKKNKATKNQPKPAKHILYYVKELPPALATHLVENNIVLKPIAEYMEENENEDAKENREEELDETGATA